MINHLTLDQIEADQEVRVVKVTGGWGLRQRLNKMGIHTGNNIFVKRSGIIGGPILVHIHGMDVAIGRGMAGKVQVERMK